LRALSAPLGHTRARQLRRQTTEAEHKLWFLLRGRRLNGWKFRRQMPLEGFVTDFACVEGRLVVELDGSQHVELEPADRVRTAKLEREGWKVVRFWNRDVMLDEEGVLATILAALPSPQPLSRTRERG
jgi:very-short-patch-repair endonuclease